MLVIMVVDTSVLGVITGDAFLGRKPHHLFSVFDNGMYLAGTEAHRLGVVAQRLIPELILLIADTEEAATTGAYPYLMTGILINAVYVTITQILC